jgi:hypothetical protein
MFYPIADMATLTYVAPEARSLTPPEIFFKLD